MKRDKEGKAREVTDSLEEQRSFTEGLSFRGMCIYPFSGTLWVYLGWNDGLGVYYMGLTEGFGWRGLERLCDYELSRRLQG